MVSTELVAAARLDQRGGGAQLNGIDLRDGDVLEVHTDAGWFSGHFRDRVHPDSGDVMFEVHVTRDRGDHAHVVVFVPPDALFRRPPESQSAAELTLTRRAHDAVRR